jgi:hypothetical protein
MGPGRVAPNTSSTRSIAGVMRRSTTANALRSARHTARRDALERSLHVIAMVIRASAIRLAEMEPTRSAAVVMRTAHVSIMVWDANATPVLYGRSLAVTVPHARVAEAGVTAATTA